MDWIRLIKYHSFFLERDLTFLKVYGHLLVKVIRRGIGQKKKKNPPSKTFLILGNIEQGGAMKLHRPDFVKFFLK